jgi:VanZ family protein
MNFDKIYKYVFVIGYLGIFVLSFVPVFGNLSSTKIGPESFKIRLDFFLHFMVYLSICLYYLIGRKLGYNLFNKHSFAKFIVLVLFLAIFTEVIQLCIPSRTFNLVDLVSNLIAVFFGIVLIRLL